MFNRAHSVRRAGVAPFHATANQKCAVKAALKCSTRSYQIPTFQKPTNSHLAQQSSEVFTSSWSQRKKSVDLGGITNFCQENFWIMGTSIHSSPFDRSSLMVRSKIDAKRLWAIFFLSAVVLFSWTCSFCAILGVSTIHKIVWMRAQD